MLFDLCIFMHNTFLKLDTVDAVHKSFLLLHDIVADISRKIISLIQHRHVMTQGHNCTCFEKST